MCTMVIDVSYENSKEHEHILTSASVQTTEVIRHESIYLNTSECACILYVMETITTILYLSTSVSDHSETTRTVIRSA